MKHGLVTSFLLQVFTPKLNSSVVWHEHIVFPPICESLQSPLINIIIFRIYFS
uniref:Uncharacterized protein n=1 Tax=Anguilla anguilla TaxID=7936 RepID=A0A0E9T9Z8_ANGAN